MLISGGIKSFKSRDIVLWFVCKEFSPFRRKIARFGVSSNPSLGFLYWFIRKRF